MNKFHSLPSLMLAALLGFLPGALLAKDNGMDLVRQLNEAFVNVSDQASASVVVVRVAPKASQGRFGMDEDNPFYDYFRRFFEEQQPERQPRNPRRQREPQFSGQGSGFIVRDDGYIVTNGHVVENAEKVKVKLKDGREYDAIVRGIDTQSDIAVLKVDAKGLPVSKLGDSSKVRVGEFAIAIGAPFDLDYTVTIGHVSAKGRSRIIPDPSMDQDFIQTDASINPGNSGGPLININGEVIGINTMIRGMNTGIGFSVPVNLAREVADKIIAEGKYVRAWLGVSITALAEFPEMQEMAKSVQDGVVVRALVPEGPAAKSDLKPSDIITTVDGHKVTTAQELKNEIRSKPLNKEVTLDVVRGGKSIKVKVRPEPWPDEDVPVSSRGSSAPGEGGRGLGFGVKPLTRELAEQLGLKPNSGLVVSFVERGSVAEESGIRAGDVITEINRKPVTNLREFGEAVKTADMKKGVILNFISGGVAKFEVLKDAVE